MKKRKDERNRLKVLVESEGELNEGWVLRLADGQLLIDSGIQYAADTEVVVYPFADVQHAVMQRFEARVVGAYEDVMVPADAEHRFLIVMEPKLSAEVRAALLDSMPLPKAASWPWSMRRVQHTHDKDILEAALSGQLGM